MREMSVAQQWYEAVRAVIADGETVTQVAARFGVSRKTVHQWLAKYEAGGLEGLADGSHRPRSCPLFRCTDPASIIRNLAAHLAQTAGVADGWRPSRM